MDTEEKLEMEEDLEELEEKHFLELGVRYWLLSMSRLNSTFFRAPTPCRNILTNIYGTTHPPSRNIFMGRPTPSRDIF